MADVYLGSIEGAVNKTWVISVLRDIMIQGMGMVSKVLQGKLCYYILAPLVKKFWAVNQEF